MDCELEKLFKQYQRVTGGKERIGLAVPTGFPCGIESWEQVAEVYNKCIKQGVTWEELLNYKKPPDDALI